MLKTYKRTQLHNNTNLCIQVEHKERYQVINKKLKTKILQITKIFSSLVSGIV